MNVETIVVVSYYHFVPIPRVGFDRHALRTKCSGDRSRPLEVKAANAYPH